MAERPGYRPARMEGMGWFEQGAYSPAYYASLKELWAGLFKKEALRGDLYLDPTGGVCRVLHRRARDVVIRSASP